MEPNLNSNVPPELQGIPLTQATAPKRVTKKFPAKAIIVLGLIVAALPALATAVGSLFIYSKVTPKIVETRQPPTTVSSVPTASSNAKISWVSNPPQLRGVISSNSGNNGQTTTNISAMCLPGTECKDTTVFQMETPNYYACTLDTQCSFFTGFTGVQTGNEIPVTGAPATTRSVPVAQNRNSAPSSPSSIQPPGGDFPVRTPTLPTAVQGSSACFNKQELLKSALNQSNLKEDVSVACECGIQPPSNAAGGSASAVNPNTGETTPGSRWTDEGQIGNTWSCMRPETRPDIVTENFVSPESISVNGQFSISFDYKNVGSVACLENYFQADVTRTVAGQSEYLGGIGAHLLYSPALKPGQKNTFTFGNKLLPRFDIPGDYTLGVTMFCESPRETHVVNGMKEIRIRVN